MEKANGILSSENDLVVIAQELGSEVKEAKDVDFASFSIPEIGLEPAVVGTVTSIGEGEVSSAVKGNNGIYVVQVTSSTESTNADIITERDRLNTSLSYRADFQAYEAIRNSVEIEDKRSKFY